MAKFSIKKITTRAKQIRRAHGGTWAAAVKKAGAEHRAGKKKAAPKKKRRLVGGTLSDSARPAGYSVGKARKRKRRRRVGATLSDSPRPAGYSIGSVSIHINHAKEILGEKIMEAELRKFKATTKRAKTKISKHISELKSKYRKLC